jgi:eukaryotic-like serine/threonine-protein kinase
VLLEGHATARFAREAEGLSELHHPGIVRHVAHGETARGELFLVMEWLETLR